MSFDGDFAEREAETAAARCGHQRVSILDLHEGAEHLLAHLRRDPAPCVGHPKLGPIGDIPGRHGDDRSGR